MSKALSLRRLAVATVIGVLGGSIFAVISDISNTPASPPIVQRPLPPPQEEPLKETDLAQVKSALGPFEPIAVSPDSPTPETNNPAILILNQDGSTLASQEWTVPFSPDSWAQRDVFQIRSLGMKLGYVTIGTSLERTFVMKVNQPFVFEEAPQQLHIIDAQGNTWAIEMTRAQALRQSLEGE